MKKNTLIITIIITIILITVIALLLVQQFANKKNPINTNSNIQKIENQDSINNELLNNQTNINNEQTNITQIPEQNIDQIINSEPEKELTTTENYYYNQLDEYGKIIYKKLEQDKEKLKTGTYIFNFDTRFNTLLHSQNGEESLNTAFQSAWDAFSYDQNDLYYIDVSKLNLIKESRTLGGITTYYVSIGPVNDSNYLQDNFQEQVIIEQAEKYINNIIKQIQEQTKNNTNIEKVKKVHDWLIKVIKYDETNELNKYNIYGALHDKRAVCEGYARSFKYIMEKIGVPCVLIAGSAQNSEGSTEVHAWNYVMLDEKWYAVDVTWDDPIINGEQELENDQKYKYYLKGSEEFLQNHTEDGVLSENGMKFSYPKLSVNNYNIQ